MAKHSTKHAVSATDTRMAKAMAHPLRVQALTILNERVASPSDIAEELDMPIGNVSYHVRALLQLGCIEEVETRPVRGALEHRYRAIRRAVLPPDAWEAVPPSARQGFAGVWFESAFGDVAEALAAGAFDADDAAHLSYTPLRLDRDAFATLKARLAEVVEEALALQEASDQRLDNGAAGGPEVRARLTLMAYDASTPGASRH